MKKIYQFLFICCLTATNTFAQAPCTISLSPPSTKICSGASVTLSASGASSYSWSTGDTTNSITVSPSSTTTYTVTGSGANCTSTSVIDTITVMAIDNATFSYTPSTVCKAGGSDPVPVLSGTTGGTFNSSDTNLTINSASGVITLASTAVGTYTVTYTTNGSCPNSKTFVISIVNMPTADFNYSGPYCANAVPNPLPTFSAGSSAGVFSSSPSGLVFVNSTTGEIDLVSSSPNTYSVTNTIAPGGCPTATYSNTITINPIPITTVNNTTICAGTAGTLTAGGGANTFTWSGGGITATGTSFTDSPSSITSYTVTGTTAGCSSTAIGTITVDAVPVVGVINPPATVCPGNSATLTATGANSYTWVGGPGGATATLTDNPLVTTTYTVTGTNGICTSTATGTITVGTSPTITTANATICSGATGAILTANGGLTYTWSTTPPQTTASINVTPTTTTIYTVTGSGPNAGCIGVAYATVTVNTTPTLSVAVAPGTICLGQTSTLTATPSGAASYAWSGGGSGSPLMISPLVTTPYTVTVTSTAGCSATVSGIVYVNPLPVIKINSPTICSGQSASLNANGADAYTWSNGATSNPVIVSPATTTSYTVTGVNKNGCIGQAVSIVSIKGSSCTPVNAPLTISVLSTDASNSTICNGTAYATVSGGVPPYNITFGGNTVVDSVYKITNLCAGFYTVNTTDAQSNSASFTFVVGSPATTFIAPNPNFIDSTVVDTLINNAIPNCIINYDAIDSIAISNFNFVGSDSINITWTIYQLGGNKTQNSNYQFSLPGVYTFILDLFCPNRTIGIAKGIDQLYINKSATGIETFTTSTLNVYPNPSNGSFKIESANGGNYSIINELGETVQEFKLNGSNQNTVNIDNLSNGIYFIIGINNGLITHQKVVMIN